MPRAGPRDRIDRRRTTTLLSRPLLAGALALLATLPCVHGQVQTLLFEDFESGAPGWTGWGNGVANLWHLAPSGECGAVTGMAAYDVPASCTYRTGAGNNGLLVSPPVSLTGVPFFKLVFSYKRQLDALGGDITCVFIGEAGSGGWDSLECAAFDNSGALKTKTLNIPPAWNGHTVQFGFSFLANAVDNTALGWLVDNVTVTNAGAWTDLGHAYAGTPGLPHLAGTGVLSATSGNQLDLTTARPLSPATLVFGLSQIDAPLKGGVLVPQPLLTIPLTTNAGGGVALPFVLPPGVPAGTALYFQFWIEDIGATLGLAASNGLKGVTS